jgi:hypothetical protein
MELPIDAADAQLLGRILTNYLSDLRMEIADTDQADLRAALKKNETRITSLVERLAWLASNPS